MFKRKRKPDFSRTPLMAEQIFAKVATKRAEICRQCKTEGDLVAAATAFLQQAIEIHTALSGPETAAKVLYCHADSLATSGDWVKGFPEEKPK